MSRCSKLYQKHSESQINQTPSSAPQTQGCKTLKQAVKVLYKNK